MGAVYVARHETTELDVALKVLWPHVLKREEAVERFGLEAKVSAKVKSEHIVQVLDAGFEPDREIPYLVMELLVGRSLQEVIEGDGPLPSDRVVELLTQVARGLDRALGWTDRDGVVKPIVHRDLKPENLFLARRESGEPLMKILDFGIAKVLSQSTSVSQEIKGTPIYLASEQASGEAVSPQTDVWAFGLIAYFLLTGDNYWRATTSRSCLVGR
jgi:serine/threonine-protein kinase